MPTCSLHRVDVSNLIYTLHCVTQWAVGMPDLDQSIKIRYRREGGWEEQFDVFILEMVLSSIRSSPCNVWTPSPQCTYWVTHCWYKIPTGRSLGSPDASPDMNYTPEASVASLVDTHLPGKDIDKIARPWIWIRLILLSGQMCHCVTDLSVSQ